MTIPATYTIQKFGGSSLATLDDVRRCARLVMQARERVDGVIVVVSAMGKRTDELVAIMDAIGCDTGCTASDALLAGGEQQSAAIMTLVLRQLGQSVDMLGPAEVGIQTDGQFGAATIRCVCTERIMHILAARGIVVVPGYQGIGPDGRVRTLGRGGSDTTAVALAAAMREAGHICECEVYSNIDAVRTADPHLIALARPLDEVDANWMTRYAAAGATLLHDRAAVLAEQHRLPVQLGCSRTGEIGTIVQPGLDLRGVTACTLQRLVRVQLSSEQRSLATMAAALSEADASTIRWGDDGEPCCMTAHVVPRGRDLLLEAFGRSSTIDIEWQPVAVVAAVGSLDATFRDRALRAHTRLRGSIDALMDFEFQAGVARWTAHESAAERLYARVHDAMVIAPDQHAVEPPLVEVDRTTNRSTASATA